MGSSFSTTTDAQRRAAATLVVSIAEHTKGVGPGNIHEALRVALTEAPLTIYTLRYLSRELDRLADQRERDIRKETR